jgi:hypothetical protein
VNRLQQVGEISRHAQAWRIPATTRDIARIDFGSTVTLHLNRPDLFLQWTRNLAGVVLIRAGYGELRSEGLLIHGLTAHIVCPYHANSRRLLCLGELEQLIARKAAA